MIVSTIVSNVGKSGGNRSLLFSLFVCVSLFFVLEPPGGVDGFVLAHEERGVELISFVAGSGVAVYARSDMVGMFDVVDHFAEACVVGLLGADGWRKKFCGVYVPPRVSGPFVLNVLGRIGMVDIIDGDFNARHARWALCADDNVCYGSGSSLARFMDDHGFVMWPLSGVTFRGVSVLDLTRSLPGHLVSSRCVDLAGLDHSAQLLRLDCSSPVNLVGPSIPWRRVDWDMLGEKIGLGIKVDGVLMWDTLRDVVGSIRRAPRRRSMPGWWTPELAVMRADVRRFRCNGNRDGYCLSRKVYRTTLIGGRDGGLVKELAGTGDPDIFRRIDRLELRRTLPTMMRTNGTYVISHPEISDMIAEQLGPVDAPLPSIAANQGNSYFADLSESDVVAAIASCPRDTSPGFDGVTYPFLGWLRGKYPSEFDALVLDSLTNDHPDFHVGEVVLIQK